MHYILSLILQKIDNNVNYLLNFHTVLYRFFIGYNITMLKLLLFIGIASFLVNTYMLSCPCKSRRYHNDKNTYY